MTLHHCNVCGKATMHKRHIGAGTVVMILLTLVFCFPALILWPFIIYMGYPLRCVHCYGKGSVVGAEQMSAEAALRDFHSRQ